MSVTGRFASNYTPSDSDTESDKDDRPAGPIKCSVCEEDVVGLVEAGGLCFGCWLKKEAQIKNLKAAQDAAAGKSPPGAPMDGGSPGGFPKS